MADLGNAYVNIVPKAQGIEGNIERMFNGGGGGAEAAGKSLGKRLLGGLTKLGIGTLVASQFKKAFEEGGNLEQSFGGLETLYGAASDRAKRLSMEMAAAGVSANDYAEQAVSFGAALKAAYGGNEWKAITAADTAIKDMTDNAAKMGTPLESIQAAYQGFARGQYQLLDNLKLGRKSVAEYKPRKKSGNPSIIMRVIRGEVARQPQRIEGEIIPPRGLGTIMVKRYAGLCG